MAPELARALTASRAHAQDERAYSRCAAAKARGRRYLDSIGAHAVNDAIQLFKSVNAKRYSSSKNVALGNGFFRFVYGGGFRSAC